MSIAVFASLPVCNNDRFIRGRKIRTSFLHPSCPYKSFSTALSLGLNTLQCSEKNNWLLQTSAHAITGQHIGPKRSAVTCSSSNLFGLYREGQMGRSHQTSLRKRKQEGAVWFSFHSSVNAPRYAAEWLDLKDLCYWKGSSGIAALCQHQKSLRGQRRIMCGTFLKHCELQNHLP